jgi:Ca2+-binding RTX toxin-like protein
LTRALVKNSDGSVTFTISPGAPSFHGQYDATGAANVDGGFDAPGTYFLLTLHGDLTIASTFVISADFLLKVNSQGLELGFNGEIDLGGFATLDVEGGAVIQDRVFAAYIDLEVDIDVIGINISGGATLQINTSNSARTVFDAQGVGHQVAATTFMLEVDATIDLFGVLTAEGSVSIGVEDGVFSIAVAATVDFFGILDIDISGYFSVSSSGAITFSFTGSLGLDLTAGSGAGEFGITGSLSVTLKNSGFSGHGSVGLVIFGEDINIASGTVSVDWVTGDWLIRAEGPLGVWVEVTSSDSFPYFTIDGGLGLFDAIFEALGDAVEAVGEALVAAAEAVADAFEDLGEAILDFGADVLEFFDGLLTDIADLADAVFDEVSSWFEDSKTVVTDLTGSINPLDYYSYTATLSDGVLTISNASATRIALAIVNGNLVVDAPDVTSSVAVATSINYERDYEWDGWPPYGEWGSWYEVSRTTQYRDITFSNMRNFAAGSVTKIVINGSSSAETLILDKGSISIDTDVYGNGGDDTIVTGQGNDRVWGGEGADTIFTYGGNDQLRGEGGHDKLMGGTGNDELYGGAGNDLLDENDGRVSPEIAISETNIMMGGDGVDIILGSPGNDTIDGGTDNDTLVGLSNDDTYVFIDGYGTDTLVDYHGKETLDFSGVTRALTITMSDTGLTASAGTGDLLSISNFVSVKQLNIGTGDDVVTITALPLHRLDIIDAGGADIYELDLDTTDTAQSDARVDIQDNGGSADRIDLDVDSTGFDIHLHPQAVLLNHLDLTFNSDVELLNLTDHAAAQTTVTTAPVSGPKALLIKSGVTITSALGQQIRLLARADFLMQVEAVITTAGNVVIRGDDEDVDSTGATIDLFGTINADQVTVYGNDDNDTVNVTNVVSGAETTVYAGAGNDTFNVGTSAPAAGGDLDRIGALLTIYGEEGLDTLNTDDSGDESANSGTLSDTTITGLDMGGGMAYATIETLNIGLGTSGDVFTIHSTHAGATHLNTNNGDDVVNVRTIAGITTVDGGSGDETFNVGSNAAGTIASPNTNTGGTVDGIGALLTVNGNDPTSGSDWLIVDDTGDSDPNSGTLTETTITGLDMGGSIAYGTIEHLIVSLGSGGNTLTITSTHGAATGAFQEDTTVNSGSRADTVNVNAVTDLLYVNGQAGGDTINVNGTGAGSVSTLNGDAGNDVINVHAMSSTLNANGGDDDDAINVNGTGGDSVATLNGDAGNDTINVRAMNGTVNANGGDDTDTINVGSVAPTLPGAPTDQQGTVDAINGLLTVNGGNGSDTLNVDDSVPAVANKSGTLTYNTLGGLALEHDIGYSQLENLNIWLATGDNSFTISSTHTGATTLSTALGNDTVNVDGASGTLTINAEAGSDVVNVRATGLGSQTNINGQGGNDTINLSDHSPLLPDAYPMGQTPPAADTEGNIDAIDGLIVIDGGADGTDVINIDDSRNTANKAGTLTSSTLRGLEWEAVAGVNYLNAEDFNLWLGTGTDGLYIDSTHAGTTDVFMGDGNATVNERDDIVAIKSIGGTTTINGQRGNDFFHVNVQAPPSANDASFFAAFKAAAAANDDLFTRTHANGLGAALNLYGDGDSDLYTVNLAGQGQALVHVHDNGAPNNGVDTLIVNGADVVSGLDNQPNDTFLLRRDFVALLNDSADADPNLDQVERINYDQNINARLIVNGLGGDDKFVADDNSTVTTLDGGDGDDTFQIGQIFGTLRDAAAGVGAGDVFDTTPVIIGVIRDPVTNAVIFDPTSFDPVMQDLSEDTVNKINAAIKYQSEHGGLALDGVAYVSQGVSHATTVFGGNGEDTFNVYHNKGTLRLEGEAGNDTFTVRAFVTIDLSVQAGTEVNGGEGADTINYAINAPVNIDGGAGFDKVVVLGTPFNDSFVVSSEGIFGAGLNVKFTNVEAAELDTLEGDDTIFILGTSEDIVTTVIGGLGNDTINVLGDVTKPIVSNDLVGSSGVITQGLTSTDADYNLVGVMDVAVNVLFSASDSLINITPTGEPLLTSEAGLLARYSISLVDPGSLGSDPVYLTVSAGVASSTDRRIGGAGVLVSVNGGAFTNAVVLTFDAASASSVFTVDVMAIDDSGAEGPRVALISHSINSANAAFDKLALIDIFVNVVDDDQQGLDIRHFSADGSVYGDNSTQVLENGFGDVYTVALTVAPEPGETVTVTLVNDTQVTVSSSILTFTAANWSTPQQLAVTAVDDGLDGISISRITHVVTSSGGLYSAFPTTASSRLSVTVHDDDTPGAIVQQSGGSTAVVEGGTTDGYRVRLTQAPDSNVTLTLRTDMQTRLSGAGLVAVDVTGSLGYFEYAYTFTTASWSSWANITVSANPDFLGPDSKVKSFSAADQNLDQIRGPLIIEGGVGAGVQREFAAPVMLPGETNDVSDGLFGASLEANDIDSLNVFHTDNSDADTGKLFYRTVDGEGHAIENVGLALTGFEMGGDVSVEQGTTGSPSTVYYGGGLTYNGFEIVEALLGRGDEALAIDDTGDRDEKNAAVLIDHASVTAIHGGGGNDTITITGRGEGPLVVYGDTSEDGLRYSNNQPAVSVHGTSFGNPGNDTINASGMLEQGDSFVGVVIFGGDGNDIITGSQDDDHLAGGTGDDTLHGQGGNDHIYGDSSFNVDPMLFAQDQITPFDAGNALELARINAMFTVMVTAAAGGDTLHGDVGDDVIFGDHGIIDQVAGTRRIMTTGAVTRIATTEPENGVADTIYGGADSDILLGGNGGDTIDAGDGNNIVLGDLGYIDYVILDQNPSDIDLIASTQTTSLGGGDSVTSGAGQDIIIGGREGDTINAGDGDNLVFGDSAQISAAIAGASQITGHSMTLGLVTSLTTADGGVDVITTGSGTDIVLGGMGADTLSLGAGNDIALGDNGELVYDSDPSANPATLDAIRSIDRGYGGADTIHGNEGDDILVGGYRADLIHGNDGADTLLGDNGELLDVETLSTLRAAKVRTTDIANSTGGDDTMEGGNEDDILMGGVGADVVDAGAGRDLVLGDQGVLESRDASVDTSPRYRSLQDTRLYGADGASLQTATAFSGPNVPLWSNWTITVGDGLDGLFGNDYIAGGAGDDMIFGQSGNDTVQGDGSIASRLNNLASSVGSSRSTTGLVVVPSFESATDGDDYIEGNAGNDVIFGNLGQDDIVGGSSNLFGLTSVAQRVDGADLIFGGAGTDLARNDLGDVASNVHARDSDLILGDNGNIFRIVGVNGAANAVPTFNYDNYDALKIVVRVAELLDYTPGGPDYVSASLAADKGAGDELHGESGDDFIYGMTGNDVLFGESQDDDLIGGWGNDWISGGTGQDGVLGDDGRIFTSRNGTAEPLNGVSLVSASHIATPGNVLVAEINVLGELNKTVDLTPYNIDPSSVQSELYDPAHADDIIYGGLGSDFLHGGSGDDAISGAEAMEMFYALPVNNGNALQFNAVTGEFAKYDETQPLKQIADFFLNFDATEGVAVGGVFSDGDDRIFGDLGNDWLVGGTGRDHLYGGWGNDLLNADDDLSTNGGLNNAPDTQSSYEDIAFGGAGRDRLIANTAGDRLVDWAGEFNSYLVPFNPFGVGTVSRAMSPSLPEFLYALSKADGADQTLGGDMTRNSEPFGELGLVKQGDVAFGSQTGSPDDPQPGSGGGKK